MESLVAQIPPLELYTFRKFESISISSSIKVSKINFIAFELKYPLSAQRHKPSILLIHPNNKYISQPKKHYAKMEYF